MSETELPKPTRAKKVQRPSTVLNYGMQRKLQHLVDRFIAANLAKNASQMQKHREAIEAILDDASGDV